MSLTLDRIPGRQKADVTKYLRPETEVKVMQLHKKHLVDRFTREAACCPRFRAWLGPTLTPQGKVPMPHKLLQNMDLRLRSIHSPQPNSKA